MVYKSQQDMIPNYITAHLIEYYPPRLLRSSEDKQLVAIKLIYIMGIYQFGMPRINWGMRHLFHSKLFLNRQFQDLIM